MLRETLIQTEFDFSGATYEKEFDYERLSGQIKVIFDLMKDGKWRTLREISTATGFGEASISAQLRNLRKPSFGGHTINRENLGSREKGLYQYQLITKTT